jgi:hypothetical protein
MKALLLAAALAASQCNPTPEPPPAPEPTGDADCEAACQRFASLGCEEAQSTPNGGTCLDVCENTQTSPAPLNLACIVRSNSCAQARECQ